MNKYRVTTHPAINQVQWRIQKQLDNKIDWSHFSDQLCILFNCRFEELEFKIQNFIGMTKLGQLSRLRVIDFKQKMLHKILENTFAGIHEPPLDLMKDFIIFIELYYLLTEDEKFLPEAIPSQLPQTKTQFTPQNKRSKQ